MIKMPSAPQICNFCVGNSTIMKSVTVNYCESVVYRDDKISGVLLSCLFVTLELPVRQPSAPSSSPLSPKLVSLEQISEKL